MSRAGWGTGLARAALLAVMTIGCDARGEGETDPRDRAQWGPGTPDPSGRLHGTPPRFEDHAVSVTYRGPIASPDLASHPEAGRFGRALRRARRQGPNFAGRYVLVTQSCGRLCREFVIMDAESGALYPGLSDTPPFDFRRDSRLIAFEAPTKEPGRVSCAGCSAAYYLWQDDRLELIPPETWVGSAPPPPSVRALVESVRRQERPELDAAAPAVTRPTWDRLVIARRDGTRHVLADRLAGDAVDRIHVFRGALPELDRLLIEVLQYEGRRFLLVDPETGGTEELDAAPVSAADGTRFVTASWDLVAGHEPNRARIYRMTDHGPRVEWSVAPAGWGVADPVWVSPDSIRFDRVTVDLSASPHTFPRTVAWIVRRGEGWTVLP